MQTVGGRGRPGGDMARRISFAVLGTGIGLTILLPVVGILTMVTGAVGLAIAREDELLFDELGTPAGWLERLHLPVGPADEPPELDLRDSDEDLAGPGILLVRCDGCDEFVACDPTDLRGTLGDDRPLCRGCRISERAVAGGSSGAAVRR
jgi:hypothetical protein